MLGSQNLGTMWLLLAFYVIEHLLDGLLLVVAKLPVVLSDDGLCQQSVLHLVHDLHVRLRRGPQPSTLPYPWL